jgi:hypothetical protein
LPPLEPQTVRIEFDNSRYRELDSDAGQGSSKLCIIFGVKGHPEYDDLNIKEWDTFIFEDEEYTVRFVNRSLIGQIQAEAIVV